MSSQAKSKRKCCKSTPRCKRCPVVLRRLEQSGDAQRIGKRTYRIDKLAGETLSTARKR